MLSQVQAAVESAVELSMQHVVVNPNLMRLGEAATSTDPISNFLQYGVLGLVVIGFATGWIVPGPQAKALAAENTRLSGIIDNKVFPMLEQYAGTMEKAASALEKAAEAMDRQAERDRRLAQQTREQR